MGQTFELADHTDKTGTGDVTAPPAMPPGYRDQKTEQEQLLAYRNELAFYRRLMTELDAVPTSEIMQKLSSTRARLREIHSDLWDMRSTQASHLRTRHVDPLLDDLKHHYQCHSRRLTDLELEWKMAQG